MQTIETKADPTRVVCGRVEVPGTRPLLVYGTVLPWNSDNLYADKSAKIDAVRRQIGEWRQVRAAHSDCHLIVAGDFNQFMAPQKSNDTLQGAIESGLRELHVTCLTSAARIANRWPHKVIDHIAVSNDLAGQFSFKEAWNAIPNLTDHGGIIVSGVMVE